MIVTHLTTALQSNASTNFVQGNATFNGTNASGTIASNAISISVNPSPAQTAFQFSNANGVTFGTNGSTVTASVQTNYQAPGAYLTTAALSQDSSKYAGINGAITGGSLTVNTSGVSINLPAYLTTAQPVGAYLTTAAEVSHSHGNPTLALTNLTGTTASNSAGFTLSLSAGVGGAGDGYNIVGVNGNSVGSANTIQFSNSNNVTFGLNGSTITASASYVNDLTSGRAGVGETVGTIAGTDLAMTVNTDGVSVGYPKWITTYAAQSVQPVAVSGSNGSFNFSTLNFVTGNGATFYTDATGIRLSYTVPAPGGGDAIRGIAAGGATLTTNTVNFSNANGVSFGFGAAGNSTVMTASYSSDHSHGNPTLALTNLTGTTASASNGFTLSLSAANPGGGAGATLSHFSPPWGASGRATNSSLGNNTLYFQPFDLPFYLSASRINFYVSISGAMSAGNSTGTCWQRASYGLYSQDSAGASTQSIRLITSYAITHLSHSFTSNTRYQATHYFGLSNATSHSTQQTAISSSNATTYLATNINGGRVLAFPLNSTLTPGRYWLAFGNATTAGNAMTNGLSVQITSVGVQPEIRPLGQASAATNASVFRAMTGWGSYSATTAAYPALVALSTDNIRHGVAMTQIHFDILGIATSTNQI